MEKSLIKSFSIQIIKGLFIALTVLLVGILIFSLIVKLTLLNETAIKAINQFIKLLAIFLACFFSIKEGKGLVKGVLIGVSFIIFSNIIFSIIAGGKLFTLAFLIDAIFGAVIGVISGVITANVKK